MAGIVGVGWTVLGPVFHYSDSWMLWINTITTILTFLLGFSIQFTQNRDTKEIKAKLNALMRQNDELSNQLDLIEKELSDEEE
jgi:low affinity Fe/Cu permease